MVDTVVTKVAIFNKVDVIQQIIGSTDYSTFFAAIFFGFIGAFTMMLVEATTRDLKTNRSPENFSWGFFFKDNVARFFTNLLLVIIVIRFAPNLINEQISTFWGFVIGLGSDKLAVLIKNKRNKVFNSVGATRSDEHEGNLQEPENTDTEPPHEDNNEYKR